MIAHTYYPTAPLAGFVDLMWLYEDYRVPHAQERLLPTGTTSLVVNLARREATLCGAHSAPFFLDTARMVAHLGVHFRPGGAFPFLGLPVHTLHNQVIDLDTLWGSTTYGLRDRLLAAPTPQAKFSVMEQTLLAHLDRLRARHPAVTFALQAIAQGPSHTPLTVITDQIGLSPRRFRQLFQETVGLTPKLFWRVQRFQQIIQQVEEAATVDWVDLALATGYFDQAHLIHDFQNLSGLTPSAYLAQRSDHRNHVPVVT